MRYLVTGGQGFVGRYVIAELLRNDRSCEIYAVGRSPRLDSFTHSVSWNGVRVPAPIPDELQRSSERVNYLAADLADADAVERVVDAAMPDVVLHMASALRGDSPESLLRTNVLGTQQLLHALCRRRRQLSMFVNGSSGSVYGNTTAGPASPGKEASPPDFYAVSKLAQEHVAGIAGADFGLPITHARIFNIVGPGQDERHVCGRFAGTVAAIARGIIPAVIEVGNLDATRDFIDVRDVALGILAIASYGRPSDTYNVASSIETSVAFVLTELLKAAGLLHKVAIVRKDIARSSLTRQVADIAALRAIGFKPRFEIARSLADVLAYYTDRVRPVALA